MAGKTMAPVTTALLADLWALVRAPPVTSKKAGDAQVLRAASRELRALLAVARAADRDLPAHARLDAIDRALARLRRRSQGVNSNRKLSTNSAIGARRRGRGGA